MSSLLAAVRRAATKRADADKLYRQAITNAYQAGIKQTAIAEAAGLSKQGVYYLTRPDPRKEQKT